MAALVFGTCAVASAVLNYWIDPYAVLRSPEAGGLPSRPAIGTHERLHKEHAVVRAQARTLLLGNSRVLNGFNPRNPLLPQPAYNAAFSSSTLFEAEKILQHAMTVQKPDLVLLGIDPAMLFDPLLVRAGFGARSLAEGEPWTVRWSAPLEEWVQLLLAPLATKDSMATLLAPATPTIRYAGGMRDTALMASNNDAAKRRALSAKILASPDPEAARQTPVSEQAKALQQIVRLCALFQTRLIVFLQPSHATRLDHDLMDDAYLRIRLQALHESLADSSGLVEFWTFLGFNDVTMDPVGDPGPMRYYWEVSHYREVVGDLIMARILAGSEPGTHLPDNFGQRVDLADRGWAEREMRRVQVERVVWQERSRNAPGRYLP